MWLEEILEDDFVATENINYLAMEDRIKKSEVKRQKHQLGVKSIKVKYKERNVWLWFIPKHIFKKYEFWANE